MLRFGGFQIEILLRQLGGFGMAALRGYTAPARLNGR
jgi:hypothetical protein